MKGTIIDFLDLISRNPELAKDLVALAAKHDFEFSDEIDEAELAELSGGALNFGKFDQKSNQLYNLLSQVVKSMNDMRSAPIKNML